jgi:hypothetical protein
MNELNEILKLHKLWLEDSHVVTKHGLEKLKGEKE